MIPNVDTVLTCITCGKRADVKAYFAKTRWGTLRLEAGVPPRWQVDGSGAYCGEHRKYEEDLDQTWHNVDTAHAYALVADAEEQRKRCEGCP